MNTEISKTRNNTFTRRDVLIGAAGAAAAASLFAGNAFASSHGGMQEDHGHDDKGHGGHHGHSSPNMSLIDATTVCIKDGELCLSHCVELIKAGDTSIAGCIASVNEMIAACTGLIKLASYKSSHLPEFAKVCIAICKDCEKECRKHEKKHAECKACAESCKACIDACEKVAA